jgi:glycine/D-amino acid oxidase-like deaminating enzyme
MSPPVSPVPTGQTLPASTEVVIIGGGIAGIAAAHELAGRGTAVLLLEKGVIAGEQSSRNWGWCRQQNRDLRELPLAQLALRIWGGLDAEIGEETGFRRAGLVYGATEPRDLAQWEAWGEAARGLGMVTRMLSGAETAAMLPGNARSWLGGLHSPTDGRAEPALATPALARAAQRRGAVLVQGCAVRALETQAGRISGVITESGSVRCQAVLVAGGAWTGAFLRHHGLRFLQASVKSTSFCTVAAPSVTEGGVAMGDITFRRRLDGGYTVGLSGRGQLQITPRGLMQARAFWPTFLIRRRGLTFSLGRSFLEGPEALRRWRADGISPFELCRRLDPAPDAHLVAFGLARLAAAYPALRGIRAAEAWGGIVDSTPDAIPVISDVAALPGLFISAGFSGHGFGVGPAAGRLAADLIRNDTPCVDPAPFRYERMIDGTRLSAPGML